MTWKKNRPDPKAVEKRDGTRRRRALPVGAKPGSHSGAALGIQSGGAPLLQLISALRKARIPFQIIGMGAAVLQGVPVVTQDIDFWIGRPLNSLVNFTYHVDGLRSFAKEMKSSKRLKLFNQRVAVLPLKRICASKAAINRPKDRVHLFYLRQAIELERKLKH